MKKKSFPSRWFALAATLLLALSPSSALARERVVTIESRTGVQQSYVLVEPASPPKVALLMLPGGPGLLRIQQKDGALVRFNEAGFMQRTRRQFADAGFIVAIVDTPSDQRELWRGFRMTSRHAQDIDAVITNLRAQHGNIPVYLIGISRGGLSVAYLARHLGNKVTGIIAMSALFKDSRGESLEFFDWKQLRQRVLIVGHRNDGCRNTLFEDSAYVAREYGLPLIAATGGHQDLGKSDRAECGPWAHHNFLGIEQPVAREIIHWILGQPFRADFSD